MFSCIRIRAMHVRMRMHVYTKHRMCALPFLLCMRTHKTRKNAGPRHDAAIIYGIAAHVHSFIEVEITAQFKHDSKSHTITCKTLVDIPCTRRTNWRIFEAKLLPFIRYVINMCVHTHITRVSIYFGVSGAVLKCARGSKHVCVRGSACT